MLDAGPGPASLRGLIDAELTRRGVTIPKDSGDASDLPELARVAARLEPGLARAFRRTITAARDQVTLGQIENTIRAGRPQDAVILFEAAGIWSEFLAPARTELARAVMAGAELGTEAAARLGLRIAFDLVNPHAVEWAFNRTNEFVTVISGTQRMTLQDIIGDAVAGHLDVFEAARLIRHVVGLTRPQSIAVQNFRDRLADDGIPAEAAEARTAKYAAAQLRHRSETIARTEILDSVNEGQHALWIEAVKAGLLDPERTRRVWITRPGTLDVEICEPLDGLTAPLNGPFKGGYMRPPAHPRCRCTVGLVIS